VTGPAVTMNAPSGANEAWIDRQIDLIRSHQQHLLKGLNPETKIQDAWREKAFVTEADLARTKAYLAERLKRLR
jgi:uncharacterized protein YaaN involved in tellurite resistance